MTLIPVQCNFCGKTIYRGSGRINEAKKFGWKPFCSVKCIGNFRNKQIKLTCSRPECRKIFKRPLSGLKKSKEYYCSLSCAASVNNSKYPKNPGVRKNCQYCGQIFVSRDKFCSLGCKNKSQIISEENLLKLIKDFYKDNSRIPFKREFHHYHAIRGRFKTWNDAIKIAGFDPNPVGISVIKEMFLIPEDRALRQILLLGING